MVMKEASLPEIYFFTGAYLSAFSRKVNNGADGVSDIPSFFGLSSAS